MQQLFVQQLPLINTLRIMNFQRISGNIVDIVHSRIYPGSLEIVDGRIQDIQEYSGQYDTYIIPGFVDSHIHIESSLLPPSEFSRLAVVHGTVAAVSDPHEIANVCGIQGVYYMIENGRTAPLKFYFGVPSCVPATTFETAGAMLNAQDVEELLAHTEIRFLSEVMNVPGVLYNDPEVIAKLKAAATRGKVIDGHAPGLREKELQKYINSGISTDHEISTIGDGVEKINLGMKVLIRQGSAAKNFSDLMPLIDDYPDSCMLCSDDLHPDDLVKGHINLLVRKAIQNGIEPMKVLRCACLNPVRHYGLDVGLLQKNDHADFLVVDNLQDLNILKTYINGKKAAEEGKTLLERSCPELINAFGTAEKKEAEFAIRAQNKNIRVIEVVDGQLITRAGFERPTIESDNIVSNPEQDILKLTVVNRYVDSKPAIGFVKNFGLKKGAIVSSVAHDSHNIIAVGVSDRDICRAVNLIIRHKGGLAVVSDDKEDILLLPIGGLMTTGDGFEVAEYYSNLDKGAKKIGAQLRAPFMTLSFLALLVIPELKLSDKGLFDARTFNFVDLFQ